MFRIVGDPSSGSIELYFTGIICSGSQVFVVCLFGVWQRNFEPVVCVYGTTSWELLVHSSENYLLNTNRNVLYKRNIRT